MKINIDRSNVKSFFKPCVNFLLVSTVALSISGCHGNDNEIVEEPVEYISLGNSDNPLKCLVVEKDNEIATAFGYFRLDSDSDLATLYFDNVLTDESINLTEIDAKADVDFYWTEAGNYLSLQQVVDNQVASTELSEFVDSCSNYSVDSSVYFSYYRNQEVNQVNLDHLSEEMDAGVSRKPFIKN